MRDNQYTTEGRIRFSEVDHTRRITLPGIVNYFQDCSTFQSEDLGLGIMHCSERKRAWILSSWQVVVERYPEIGEEIQTSTWATDFKGLFGERNFCMTDENGNDVIKTYPSDLSKAVETTDDETVAASLGRSLSSWW